MRERILFLLVLTTLLVGTLASVLNTQPVESGSTTIVVPDDYPTIQEAINHAYNGDTVFVSSGIYYENVVVNKTISLIGEDPATAIIDGSGVGNVINVTSDNTTVMGFKMRNGTFGIVLDRVQNCNATGNNLADNGYGVVVQCTYWGADGPVYRPCFNDSIVGNNITNSTQAILVYFEWAHAQFSYDNTISGNIIRNCQSGIFLGCSRDNIITKNSVVGGINLLGSCNRNVISENSVEGGINLEAAERHCLYVGARNNTISRNYVTNSSRGISLTLASNSCIFENNITNNLDGVCLSGSNGNCIARNNIVANDGFGIAFDWTYEYTDGYEKDSDENNVSENNIAGNLVGVWLNSSSSNRIIHNYFAQNSVQARVDSLSLNNSWDDGYPSGGNCWSDHTDVDVYSGSSQTTPGSDGIWDRPYAIDANNTDHYPMVEPFGPHDTIPPETSNISRAPTLPNYDETVTVDATVTDNVAVDQTILSYTFNLSWINVTMAQQRSEYVAAIPSQPYGTSVQYKIYANDTSGNWAASEVYSYTVADTEAPQVLAINALPTCPNPFVPSNVTRANEPTLITANISEPVAASGMSGAFFSYRADSGNWWNTSMDYNSTTNLWTTTVPAQSNTTNTIEFFIEAYDNAGNVATSLVQTSSVEAMLAGDINGDGKVNMWDVGYAARHLGDHSADYIVLAFDDGKIQCANDQTVAIMDSYGYKGVVFAVRRWTNAGSGVWNHILAEGWEIGCHSWSHPPDMTKLSASELVHETADAKAWLEQAFGVSIISFAYPGSAGWNNATVLNALGSAGFLYGRDGGWAPQWSGTRSLQIDSRCASQSSYASEIALAINNAQTYGISVIMFHDVVLTSDPNWWEGSTSPDQFRYCLTQIRNAGLVPTTFKEWDQMQHGTLPSFKVDVNIGSG